MNYQWLTKQRLLTPMILVGCALPQCHAQQVSIQVPGVAQIALAGAPSGSQVSSDSAPLNSPVLVNLPVSAGQTFQFQASGLVGQNNSKPTTPPNGGTSFDDTQTSSGIARITGPDGALVGVFIGASVNRAAIPPAVNFTGAAQDILVVTPMLQQPFFVGTGSTADGTPKTYVAPNGAAGLYVGVLGYTVANNTGSFTVIASVAPAPPKPGNTVIVYGVSQIALAGALSGTSLGGDSAPLNLPIQVNVPITAGQAIQIKGTGLVGQNAGKPTIPPDGGTSLDDTQTGSGIARITGAGGALVGVFTSDAVDPKNIPPAVNFASDASNIPLVTPMLQQPFLIGAGTSSDGAVKTWVAPAQATRLYLGVLGYSVGSNTGSFIATVTITSPPDLPTNPVRVSGTAQIALAGASAGATASGDSTPLNAPSHVQVPLLAGQALQFSAWGSVGQNDSKPSIPPDGGTSRDDTQTSGGIARITGPAGALIGVFTGPTINLNSVPPAVDYSSQAARDIDTIRPLLQQPFFIGSGLTSTGALRQIIVPAGAVNLFVGTLGYSVNSNSGSYVVVASPNALNTPGFPSNGILNAAGFGPNPLAAGSVAALFGSNLAVQTQSATSVPLPNSLVGTRAYVDLLAAPLYFVSAGQLNFQVPFEINAQQAHLTITRNGAASLPVILNLSPYAPGIFTASDGSPIIVDYRTGALVSGAQPAKPGDVMIVYATGLGPIANPPPSGTPTPSDQLFKLAVPTMGVFGSQSVTADFAGLAPGLIGVYQVNVTVPSLAAGQTTFQLRVSGVSSNAVSLTVGQ